MPIYIIIDTKPEYVQKDRDSSYHLILRDMETDKFPTILIKFRPEKYRKGTNTGLIDLTNLFTEYHIPIQSFGPEGGADYFLDLNDPKYGATDKEHFVLLRINFTHDTDLTLLDHDYLTLSEVFAD